MKLNNKYLYFFKGLTFQGTRKHDYGRGGQILLFEKVQYFLYWKSHYIEIETYNNIIQLIKNQEDFKERAIPNLKIIALELGLISE